MKRFAKTLGWATVAGTIGGVAALGRFDRMMDIVLLAMIAVPAATLLALAVSITRRFVSILPLLGRIVQVAILCIPVIVVVAEVTNELGRLAVKRYVEKRAPRLEQIRAERGAYPRSYDSLLGDRIRYVTDGKTYSVIWNDRLICGRSMQYHSATGQWTEAIHPCYF